MEGDLSEGEIPDDQIQPPSRDDLPDADPALVKRGRASPYPPTASDHARKTVDATIPPVVRVPQSTLYIVLAKAACTKDHMVYDKTPFSDSHPERID